RTGNQLGPAHPGPGNGGAQEQGPEGSTHSHGKASLRRILPPAAWGRFVRGIRANGGEQEFPRSATSGQGGPRRTPQRVSSAASSTTDERVTNRAFSDAKKTTPAATSSGSTHGTGSRLPAERSAICCGVSPSRAASPSFIGVLTPVGWMATT